MSYHYTQRAYFSCCPVRPPPYPPASPLSRPEGLRTGRLNRFVAMIEARLARRTAKQTIPTGGSLSREARNSRPLPVSLLARLTRTYRSRSKLRNWRRSGLTTVGASSPPDCQATLLAVFARTRPRPVRFLVSIGTHWTWICTCAFMGGRLSARVDCSSDDPTVLASRQLDIQRGVGEAFTSYVH